MNGVSGASFYGSNIFLPDTIDISKDTSYRENGIVADTVVKSFKSVDSTGIKKERTTIDNMIVRTAVDSIVQDLANKKVYMFGEAEVTYGDIKLKAAFIAIPIRFLQAA